MYIQKICKGYPKNILHHHLKISSEYLSDIHVVYLASRLRNTKIKIFLGKERYQSYSSSLPCKTWIDGIKAINFICYAASIHSLSTPVGSLLSGPLLEMIGRRSSLQWATIPLCIGWLIIGFSKSVVAILIGRIVCGISVGLMPVPSQVQ